MKITQIYKFIPVLSLILVSFACTKKDDQQPLTADGSTVVAETVTAAPPAEAANGATGGQEGGGGTTAGPDLTTDSSGLSKAVVVMKTSKGTVKFKFYSKDAPKTVSRFVELVQSKFYDGLSFHRVVPGFVVQTGDPKSKNKSDPTLGTGGSGVKQKAEFNSRKHVRGTIAMARAADPDSADSQFYIAMGTYPHLDEKYTVFGQVVDFGEKVGDKDVVDRVTVGDDLLSIHIE